MDLVVYKDRIPPPPRWTSQLYNCTAPSLTTLRTAVQRIPFTMQGMDMDMGSDSECQISVSAKTELP